MKKFLKSIISYCYISLELYGHLHKTFVAFILFNCLYQNFILSHLLPIYYVENQYLNFIYYTSCIFAAFLILSDYWPAKIRPLIPLCWYLLLIFSIPFSSTVTVMLRGLESIWVAITFISLVLLSIFISWIDFIIINTIGIFFGTLYVYLYHEAFIRLNLESFLLLFHPFLLAFLASIIISQKREIINSDKRHAVKSIASMIAHEIRNPLFAIKGGIFGLKNNFKNFNLEKASHTLEFMERTITESNFIIQMILTRLQGIASINSSIYPESIKKCIDEAMAEYPLLPHYKDKIYIQNDEDFVFNGNKELIKHVLFNLIKNSLYYSTPNSKVFIKLYREKDYNILEFSDTGKGINPYKLNFIFKGFYSTQEFGSGLGLYFCAEVMRKLNGYITCTSEESKYTTFKLYFPKLN